jgi:hypothetical protein
MAGYSTTVLPKTLGIREGALVALLSPPPLFAQELEPLPKDARVMVGVPKKGTFDVAIVFATKKKNLEIGLKTAMKSLAQDGGIWIAWPKKSSGLQTEVDEFVVRHTGLASGLVDNKVCAIDDTWSGLRFVIRKSDRKS